MKTVKSIRSRRNIFKDDMYPMLLYCVTACFVQDNKTFSFVLPTFREDFILRTTLHRKMCAKILEHLPDIPFDKRILDIGNPKNY